MRLPLPPEGGSPRREFIMGKKTTAQKNQGECQKPIQCTWLRFTAGGTDRRLRPIVFCSDL